MMLAEDAVAAMSVRVEDRVHTTPTHLGRSGTRGRNERA